MKEIICFKLENELDLVLAHRRSMQLAELCGFNLVAQTSFATAVSEVARFMIEKGRQSEMTLSLGKLRSAPAVIRATIESPFLEEIDQDNENFRYARKLANHFELAESSLAISANFPKSVTFSNALVDRCLKGFTKNQPISTYEEVRRKNAELQELADNLVESETRYQELTNSLPLMMFAIAADNRMLYANEWFLRFVEKPLDSLRNLNWFELFEKMHLDADLHYLKVKLEEKEAFQQEVMLSSKSGKVWHLLSLTPQLDHAGQLLQWFGFIVNIHAQKVVDQTLRDNQELVQIKEMMEVRQKQLDHTIGELNRSNHELARYAYVASHDLQEPIRKVRLLADMVLSKYEEYIPADGIDLLTRLKNSSERMHMIVRDLLAYSRLNSDAISLKEQIDLSTIINLTVENLEFLIQNKRAKVTVEQSMPLTGNIIQLLLLFQNLIANAIKFTAQDVEPVVRIIAGALTVAEADQLQLDPNNQWICIRVIDNGIGFEQRYAEKIFEVFQRLHGRSEYEGTGIGLSVCKKIVELHGGHIASRSSLGQGSDFQVYLPRRD